MAATDYDAPRRNQAEETADDPLVTLTIQRNDARSGAVDVDETETNAPVELLGVDLSDLPDDELIMRVVPKQADEFTCASCFLVNHRSRLAPSTSGQSVCRDCA